MSTARGATVRGLWLHGATSSWPERAGVGIGGGGGLVKSGGGGRGLI